MCAAKHHALAWLPMNAHKAVHKLVHDVAGHESRFTQMIHCDYAPSPVLQDMRQLRQPYHMHCMRLPAILKSSRSCKKRLMLSGRTRNLALMTCPASHMQRLSFMRACDCTPLSPPSSPWSLLCSRCTPVERGHVQQCYVQFLGNCYFMDGCWT